MFALDVRTLHSGKGCAMIRIKAEEAEATLASVLLGRGCPADHAAQVAREMARNSLEGTYTHGIHRFPRLIDMIDKGLVKTDVEPLRIAGFGALERYDGRSGLGVVNAWICMGRAIELAAEHGIGCVSLRNTNHWMRAATYGYQACEAGMAGLCFSNTLPNMPTWGSSEPRLGNNPLVMAFPYRDGDVLVDMAMSQYSYGALESAMLAGETMPFAAGFDAEGRITCDPGAVFRSKRTMPIGYWKGAALSFVLDVFASGLSQGNSVSAIGAIAAGERDLSQVFMAIDFAKIVPRDSAETILREAVEDLLASKPDGSPNAIVYPGQRMRGIRARNLNEGIPVDERIWAQVKALGR
jgi:3-dehydro-L-gulonate 2-dehydrogenase